MTQTTLQGGFTGEAFEAFLQSRAEPAWLADLRREAWETFCELPLPERRQEEWMRTDIRGFRLEQFGLPAARGEAISPPPSLLSEGVDLAGSAVSVDSGGQRSSLGPAWAARGVLFGSLEQMAVEHGQLLRPILQRPIIPVGYDKFAALQAACWSGGTLLYVPKGVVVDQPFHVLAAIRAGGVDLGRCSSCWKRAPRRRPGRDRQPRPRRPGAALRLRRVDLGRGLAAALRRLAKLGPRDVVLRP